MLKQIRYIAVLGILTIVATGCASTQKYSHGYKVNGREFTSFKSMDDENALNMVVQIYNAPVETYEETVAKNITVEKYLELLKKRNSKYLKESGIFDVKYEKVDLKKWTNDDLITVFDALEKKRYQYSYRKISELTEDQNTKRIIQFTGMQDIAKELKGRSNKKQAMDMASQALMIALGIAMAII